MSLWHMAKALPKAAHEKTLGLKADLFEAIAHGMMDPGERNQKAIIDAVQTTQPTAAKHLAVMIAEGVITEEAVGMSRVYALASTERAVELGYLRIVGEFTEEQTGASLRLFRTQFGLSILSVSAPGFALNVPIETEQMVQMIEFGHYAQKQLRKITKVLEDEYGT